MTCISKFTNAVNVRKEAHRIKSTNTHLSVTSALQCQHEFHITAHERHREVGCSLFDVMFSCVDW